MAQQSFFGRSNNTSTDGSEVSQSAVPGQLRRDKRQAFSEPKRGRDPGSSEHPETGIDPMEFP